MRRAVLLSGDHPTLPEAELRALVAVHDPGARIHVDGLVATVAPATAPSGQSGHAAADRWAAAVDDGLRRMALCAAWGDLWGETAAGPQAGPALAEAVARHADGHGTAGVHFERRGMVKDPDALALTRVVGQALKDAGHSIRLDAPERRIFLWFAQGRALVGEWRGEGEASTHRAVEKRMHFSPVSLHPRRAAGLLHLARVPPGGRVYDPFCGTGGFVLEAALEGYDALGSDLDGFMVQGTLQALADVGPQPLDGVVFEADIDAAAALVGEVDGIVTDLPYGRASSTAGEDLGDLYERAFRAFEAMLAPGARAVVGLAEPALLGRLGPGFEVEEHHTERMHRSLTRHFVVLRRRHPR